MNRVLLVTSLLISGAFAGSSTLLNGNFESDLTGWTVWGGVVTNTAHTGAKAVKVSNAKPTWSGVDQVIDIPTGVKKVRISGWIKSDSIVQGKEKWEIGRIAIEFHDPKGGLVNGYPPVVGEVVGTKAWAHVEHEYDVPTGASSVKLQCALGNTVGSLYCDDIALEYSK